MTSELNKTILKLYGRFLSEDGNKVDYAGLANSPLFEQYQLDVGQLKVIQLFYNTVVVDVIIMLSFWWWFILFFAILFVVYRRQQV